MRGLTCRDVTSLAGDHLDGILKPQHDVAVKRHLATCPGCTRFVEQLATTVALLGRLREWPVRKAQSH